MPGVNLGMQGFTDCSIEISRVSGLEHYAKIIAVGPIALRPKLHPNTFIEDSARQRIGEGYSDIIRPQLPHQGYRLLKFDPSLTGVAELQEEACANAGVSEPITRDHDRIESNSLVHGVQYGLRARLDPHPHLSASCRLQLE